MRGAKCEMKIKLQVELEIEEPTHTDAWNALLDLTCQACAAKQDNGGNWPTYVSGPSGVIDMRFISVDARRERTKDE